MVAEITDSAPAGLVFHPTTFLLLFSSPDIQSEETCVGSIYGLKIITSRFIPEKEVIVVDGNNRVIKIINLDS